MSHNSETTRHATPYRTAVAILVCGIAIVAIGFGARQSFGLFMRPISADLGWGREVLSFALALQAMVIGFSAPVSGAAADRFGAGRVLMVGGVLLALGVFGMSVARTPWLMLLCAGPLVGMGMSAMGMPVVLGMVGRIAPEKKRSLWFGIATACSTLGQLIMIPSIQFTISRSDWPSAMTVIGVLAACVIPIGWVIKKLSSPTVAGKEQQSLGQALGEASRHRGYVLLTIGFFVCGFHVAFLAAHLPAYIADRGLSPALGATALLLIALFNMFGSWLSGFLGGSLSKKYLLVFIYSARAVVFAAFIVLPSTPLVVFGFAAIMGMLWLSTVPLTTGIIAQVFGTRYMSTLYAITFLSHQLGSFLGVWLGGKLYDTTGSYDPVWWLGVALGVAAAVIHLPINERPLARLRTA